MRRILTLCGLALALAGGEPARAFPLGQRAPVLTPSACANVTVKVDFTANDGGELYCLNGTRYPSFAAIPGATVTRASAKTCATSTGAIVTAAANVLCVTDLGALIEEGRTNSFLNSAVGATQSVTTTAGSWTLSFYGTGGVVLSGACSGTLNGTGASARVSLTATCTAGSTTLTVSGSTAKAQFEAGAFATSYVVTTGAAATRAADSAFIPGVSLPNGAASWTLYGQAFLAILPTYQGIVGVDEGLGNDQVTMFASQGNRPRVQLSVGGGTTYDSGSGLPLISPPVTVKIGASYAGKITAEAQGFSLAAASATVSTSTTRLILGRLNGNTFPTNGYLQRVVLYPSAILGLTN